MHAIIIHEKYNSCMPTCTSTAVIVTATDSAHYRIQISITKYLSAWTKQKGAIDIRVRRPSPARVTLYLEAVLDPSFFSFFLFDFLENVFLENLLRCLLLEFPICTQSQATVQQSKHVIFDCCAVDIRTPHRLDKILYLASLYLAIT